MPTTDIANSPVVEIFWTGGWDSSFRIISLAEKAVTIQPFYLGDQRKSEWNELNAMKEIEGDLLNRDATKCTFRPVKIIQTSEVEEDADITRAYQTLQSKLGSQYDWLARFAKTHPGIELCIHKDDRAFTVMSTLGSVRYVANTIVGSYFEIDRALSDPAVLLLFGNLRFPLLNLTKQDMKERSIKEGTFTMMEKTWFCHRPIHNEPCGVCNPCTYSIEEGMQFRFSPAALRRYRWHRSSTRSFLRKVKRGTMSVYKSWLAGMARLIGRV
jgi:7-cyano-7-deazaguanine synthase